MTAKDRFIKSAIAAAKTEAIQMPWTRGTRRAETIARRDAPAPKRAASAR